MDIINANGDAHGIMSSSRIGPCGEVYHANPAKEQTFVVESLVGMDRWQTPADGAKAVAALLRHMAEIIEQHQEHLCSDPKPPFGDKSYQPGEPITTQLCSLQMHGFIEDPPFYNYSEHYRMRMTARLGFE